MADRLSALPTELSLRMLLHLPDLKALYAAMLASPRLWAVLRQNAYHVFWTIVKRSMPDGLIAPMLLYIKIRRLRLVGDLAKSQNSTQLFTAADIEAINEETEMQDALPEVGLFHIVAQAVRIHDLAYFVLRTKLDYLTTLKYYRLEGDHHLSDYALEEHKEFLRAIPTPTYLKDPSWVEESRAVRALWLLAAIWRSEPYRGLDTASDALPAALSKKIASTVEEMRLSLLSWPTLKKPATSNIANAGHTTTDDSSLSALECYGIPSPLWSHERMASSAKTRAPPSHPQFSNVPAHIPTPTPETDAWGQSKVSLKIGPYNWTSINVLAKRPNTPWQPYGMAGLDTFRRLGFILWDHYRTSTELKTRGLPRLFLSKNSRGAVEHGTVGHVDSVDSMYRHFELLVQEQEREKEGWERWSWQDYDHQSAGEEHGLNGDIFTAHHIGFRST